MVTAEQVTALASRLGQRRRGGREPNDRAQVPLFVFDAGDDPIGLTVDLAGAAAAILVRIRADRVFYHAPAPHGPGAAGRLRRHGARFVCADAATWLEPAQTLTLTDEQYGRVRVQAWSGPAPQADRTRPLGHRRRAADRVRHGDPGAGRAPAPAESAISAYTQLRLARGLIADTRLPWERPLNPNRLTPTRVRRGFRRLRVTLGTPANPAKPSRPGPGRPKGSHRSPAPRYPAIKKAA